MKKLQDPLTLNDIAQKINEIVEVIDSLDRRIARINAIVDKRERKHEV